MIDEIVANGLQLLLVVVGGAVDAGAGEDAMDSFSGAAVIGAVVEDVVVVGLLVALLGGIRGGSRDGGTCKVGTGALIGGAC